MLASLCARVYTFENIQTLQKMKNLPPLTKTQKLFVDWADNQSINKNTVATDLMGLAFSHPYAYLLIGFAVMVAGVYAGSSFVYWAGLYYLAFRYLAAFISFGSSFFFDMLKPPSEGTTSELKKVLTENSILFLCSNNLKKYFKIIEDGDKFRKAEKVSFVIGVLVLNLLAWNQLPGVNLREIGFDLTMFWSVEAFFILAMIFEMLVLVASRRLYPGIVENVDRHLDFVDSNEDVVKEIIEELT